MAKRDAERGAGATGELAPGPHARPEPPRGGRRQAPTSAIAARLAGWAKRGSPLVFVASSERRAEEVARGLCGLAPEIEALLLPPWDCLPFDRASPSREAMGRRARTVRALSRRAVGPRALVLSPESLVQRLPPTDVISTAFRELRVGDQLDREAFQRFAFRTGYVADDRIDEPGEVAFLGEVIDVFPPDAAQPVRIVLGDDGRITEMRTYDPISQRSQASLDILTLTPASEYILPDDADVSAEPRAAGIEHGLAEHYGRLITVFELLPRARVVLDEKTPERLAQVHDQVVEAFEARRDLGLLDDPGGAVDALYLTEAESRAGLHGWASATMDLSAVNAVAGLAGARNPGRAFCDLVSEHRAAARRVVLSGLEHERRALQRARPWA